jgi:hypothetical protein
MAVIGVKMRSHGLNLVSKDARGHGDSNGVKKIGVRRCNIRENRCLMKR